VGGAGRRDNDGRGSQRLRGSLKSMREGIQGKIKKGPQNQDRTLTEKKGKIKCGKVASSSRKLVKGRSTKQFKIRPQTPYPRR